MKTRIPFLVLLFACLQLSAQYTDQDIVNYLNQYKDLAIQKMYQYKIPASITLAQGVFESACGTSRLAKEGNNHFGIKCHNTWTGDTLRIDDDELQECFRKYATAEESYNDHSLFLTSRSRYANLFDLDVMDYESWAKGLKAAGYATNPKYAERLIDLIQRFNIAQYDTLYQQRLASNWFIDENVRKQEEVAQVEVKKPQSPKFVAIKKDSVYAPKQSPDKPKPETSKCLVFTATPTDFPKVKYPFTDREVFSNNKTYFVIATENDTYASIAKDVQDTEKNLRKYNDVTDSKQQLVPGEVVYLGVKGKAGVEKNHLVQTGETLRYIAQKYGIRLNFIYKYNNLNENSVIHPNDIIILKH